VRSRIRRGPCRSAIKNPFAMLGSATAPFPARVRDRAGDFVVESLVQSERHALMMSNRMSVPASSRPGLFQFPQRKLPASRRRWRGENSTPRSMLAVWDPIARTTAIGSVC